MTEQFSCSVHDLLHKHGFLEGDLLISEEEPLVEQGGYAVSWNDDIDISKYELWRNGSIAG